MEKIKSALDAAQVAVQMEVDNFVNYAKREIDPSMSSVEALVLAAMALHNLPDLFAANPDFLQNAREAATDIRLELTLSTSANRTLAQSTNPRQEGTVL